MGTGRESGRECVARLAAINKSYGAALEKIYSLDRFGSRLGLGRIRRILRALGSPEKSYRCALVAGSNGKGSTVEFIGAGLAKSGFRAGTYFSPQVREFAERFRVNGKNAGRGEIVRAYSAVSKAAAKVAPAATFFEIVTAMALLIFKWREVDIAVLEVGLGGRLDATNAVEPEVSAITSLSLEHTDVLGSTMGKIAHEKCGIARKGRPVVFGKLGREARKAVEEECRRRGAWAVFPDAASLPGRIAAQGEFQRSNAAVALEACRRLGADAKRSWKGIGRCKPCFRLERRGNLLLDCCHNPEAASALAKEVSRMKVPGKKVLLFSAMKDKDYGLCLAALAPQFGEIVLCEVGLERGERLPQLARAARKAGAGAVLLKDAKQALSVAGMIAGKRGLVCVAGSIYLLSELFGKDKIRVAQ